MPVDITIKQSAPGVPEIRDEAGKEAKTPMELAYKEGVRFGLAGKEDTNNPFGDDEKELQAEWKRGWDASKYFVNRCGA